MMARALTVATALGLLAVALSAQAPPAEEIARRQFESGRAFLRDRQYAEALNDFQRVVDSYSSSSVADDALIAIARYHLDISGDLAQAQTAADTILKKYSASDSAPEAYIVVGRIGLAGSRRAATVEAALANFERVPRLFVGAPAVPEALYYAGEAMRLLRRPDDALARYVRVGDEHPEASWATPALIGAGMALAAAGDAVGAMEQFQRARNRNSKAPEAASALARSTILYRLYVRGQGGGPAFRFDPAGADQLAIKLNDVRGLAISPLGLAYATENSIGIVGAPAGTRLPSATRPTGLAVDRDGQLVALQGGALVREGAVPVTLTVPRAGDEPRVLKDLLAAVATSAGDWLVADKDDRAIQLFQRGGQYVRAFATARVSRLAINEFDEVAAIDRDNKGILLFDGEGKTIGRIGEKGIGYLLDEPEDLAYDAFGHLYVLDRNAVFVFSPKGQLLASYSEPVKSPGAFQRATALAVDAFGRLFVFDQRVARIQRYQ
jgi:tetratricopeptide (TPR) repeat protein